MNQDPQLEENFSDPIKLGISSCLLGNPVRYDGGHKLDRYLRDTLGQYVQFVPVCPETECGLPVPREAMRLTGAIESPRLMTRHSGIDHTERMLVWAQKRLDELAHEKLCGFIFKKNSPSSGLLRVKVYNHKGNPVPKGSGLFANAFRKRFPLIPVEEEGRLHDLRLRENFIERVFALKRWRALLARVPRLGQLVDFHSREKLLLLSHSTVHYRQMGKLVAEGKGRPISDLCREYEHLLMVALQLKATAAKNVNVLQHIMGYFKKQLDRGEKLELLEILGQYRSGQLPLVVPITLVNHYVRKYGQSYLARQTYLCPHPVALQLRNHV